MGMDRTERLNLSLFFGEFLAEKLIEKFGLAYDDFEHDLFYGHPDAALMDILYELDETGRSVSKTTFQQIILVVDGVRGPVDAAEASQRYEHLVEKKPDNS